MFFVYGFYSDNLFLWKSWHLLHVWFLSYVVATTSMSQTSVNFAQSSCSMLLLHGINGWIKTTQICAWTGSTAKISKTILCAILPSNGQRSDSWLICVHSWICCNFSSLVWRTGATSGTTVGTSCAGYIASAIREIRSWSHVTWFSTSTLIRRTIKKKKIKLILRQFNQTRDTHIYFHVFSFKY